MKVILLAVLQTLWSVAFSQVEPVPPPPPEPAETRYNDIGNEYINDKKYSAAEKIFRKALKTDSLNPVYQSQLAFTLIKQKRHAEAQQWLDKVLASNPQYVPSLWYSGINSFEDGSNTDFRKTIRYFDTVLPLLDPTSGQYFSAHWFIGKCYDLLLRTSGITYPETSRMLECYTVYLEWAPGASDAAKISAFIKRIKEIRPSSNVEKWVYQ